MASTPRSCASLRMLSASSPPSSAMLIAARSTRSLLKGTRGSALRSTRDAISVLLVFDPRGGDPVRGLDNLTAYGSVLRCTKNGERDHVRERLRRRGGSTQHDESDRSR